MTSRLTFTPGGHRYRLDGREIPSVTKCLKVLAKDALVQWAANEAADYAIDHWDQLNATPPSDRRALIASAHRARRDRAAASGTQMHKWAEQLIAGTPVEIPRQHARTVESLARWWEASMFISLAEERKVWSDRDDYLGTAYAGTFDALAEHPSHGVALLDWKTGKGVYPEFAVQLAAYAAAEHHQVDGADLPAPRIDTLAVVHITTEGPVLHVLDRQQARVAADRWELVRGLATIPDPEFAQEAS